MKTTNTAKIQFNEVNVSSLKAVVNMYQNKSALNSNSKDKSLCLINNLGLPLSVASFENRVIGYAFVTINNAEEPEINSYWEKEFYSIEAEQNLKFHAETIFNSTFKDAEKRSVKIQNAADKLSNWLSVCN